MFETFYQSWERTAFLGNAYALGQEITVNNIEKVSSEENIDVIKASIAVSNTADGKVQNYDTQWRMIYDASGMIQKVELQDDAGYLESGNTK